MDIFELAAKLSLDASEFTEGISAAKSQATSLGDTLSGAVGAVVDVGEAVGSVIADSVSVASEFDSAMSQVAATMGYSLEDLNTEGSAASETLSTLSSFAQEMGATTAFSATEAASALNYMALAGYDAETSMEMLPNVLNLAAAGGMELAEASDMVTDVQSAFGLSLEETSTMVDQMALTSSKTNTSVQQLGEAFLTVGANAKSLSGGTAEAAQVLGVLADNGIKGAEGGTHLRNVMLSLASAGSSTESTLSALGVSVYDVEGEMRPLADIFTDLSDAMSNFTDAEKTSTLSEIFNTTDLASVNALLSTSTERWNELSTAISDSSGAAANMAEVQLDNLDGATTLLKSAVEGLKISFGSMFTDIIQEATEGVASFVSAVTAGMNEGGLTGAFSAAIEWIKTAFSNLVAEVPTIIAELIPQITSVMSSIGTEIMNYMPTVLETIMQILPQVFDALPGILQEKMANMSELITTIGTLAAEYVPQLIQTVTEGIVAAIPGLVSTITTLFTTVLPALVTAVVTALPTILESLVSAVMQIIPALVSAFSTAAPEVANSVSEMASSAFTAISGKVVEWAGQIGTAVTELAQTIYDKLPSSMQSALSSFGALCQESWQELTELFSSLWESIKAVWEYVKAWFETLWNVLGPVLTAVGQNIIEFIKTLWENVKTTVKTLINIFTDIFDVIKGLAEICTGVITGDFSKAAQGVEDAFNGVVSFFEDIWENIKSIFSHAAEYFSEIGKNMWEGLKQGISNAIDGAKNWASNIVSTVTGVFDEHSPSKVFRKIGSYLTEGLMIGMNSGLDSYLNDYADTITGSVSDIYGNIKYSESAVGKSTADSISSAFMNSNANGNTATINLTLDSKVLATALYNPLSNVVTQKGVAIGAAD